MKERTLRYGQHVQTPEDLAAQISACSAWEMTANQSKIWSLLSCNDVNLCFIDLKFAASKLFRQTAMIRADGVTVLNVVIDYSVGSDALLDRLEGDARTTRVAGPVLKFYDANGVRPEFQDDAVKLEDFPSALKAAGLSTSSVLVEWSISFRNLRSLTKTVHDLGYDDVC